MFLPKRILLGLWERMDSSEIEQTVDGKNKKGKKEKEELVPIKLI